MRILIQKIQLIQKTKRIIQSDNGESLVESIVSLLVLSILLVAVITMIQTSLRITRTSTQNAIETQNILNSIALSEYSNGESTELAESSTITFSISHINISATHNIILNKIDGIAAFTPSE